MIQQPTHGSPDATFVNQTVDAQEVKVATEHATSVSFLRCTSTEWPTIAEVLSTSPIIQSLSLKACNIPNGFCRGIKACQTLLALVIRKPKVMKRIAASRRKELSSSRS